MIRLFSLLLVTCWLISCDSKDTRVFEPSQTGGDTDTVTDNVEASCTNGESCDDGIECTTDDICTDGVCKGFIRGDSCLIDDECYSGSDFNPGNRCQFCSPAQNQEEWTNLPNGQTCNDSAECTSDDVCQNGTCTGDIADGYCLIGGECFETDEAKEGNICLVCDPDYDPVGWRSYTMLPECDDNDPCTTDSCDLDSGICSNEEIANDCGTLTCGASPSGCYECGDCEGFNHECLSGQCNILVDDCGDSGGLQDGAAWPMVGYCVTHQGRSPYSGPIAGQVQVAVSTGGAIRSAPAISGSGRLYVGSTDGKLYIYNPSSDSLECTFTAGDEILSTPAIHKSGTVFFGCQNGYLYGINMACNQLIKFQADGAVYSSPVIGADGTVYFTTEQGSLYAIDPSRPAGEQLKWKWSDSNGQVTRNTNSSPTIDADGNILFGSVDGIVVAIDPDGEEIARRTGVGSVITPIAISGDGEILTGTTFSKAYSLTLDSVFSEDWVYDAAGPVFGPAIGTDGVQLFPAKDENLYAFNPSDGTVDSRWTIDLQSPSRCTPLVGADGLVYVGTQNSHLFVIDPSGSGSVKSETVVSSQSGIGGQLWGLSMAKDGTLYIACEDGNLYSFQ